MGKISKHQQPICNLQCQDKNLDPMDNPRDAGDSPCDLRCVDEGPVELEDVGPDQLVLVDPPDELYKQTMYESAFITLAYFALGATFMPIVWFALSFSVYYYVNLHVLIFTLGYQLIMPISFLMMHRLDGAGVWVKESEKRQQSLILRMVSFGCTIIGIWALVQWIIFRGCMVFLMQFSVHTFTGFMTIILSIVDTVALFLHFNDEISPPAIALRFACFVTFWFSSFTFISGLYKPSLLLWFPTKQFFVFMTLFCLYYTSVVTYRPIKNVLSAIFYKPDD